MSPPRSAAECQTVFQSLSVSEACLPLPDLSALSGRETDACVPGSGGAGRLALGQAGSASLEASDEFPVGSDSWSGSSSSRHPHAMARGTPDSSCSSSTHTDAPEAGKPRRTLSDDMRSDVSRGSPRDVTASLARSPAGASRGSSRGGRPWLCPLPGGAWMPVEGFEGCAIDLSQLYVGQRFAEGTFGKLYQGVYRRQDVAVKILKLPDRIEGDHENERLRELVAKQFWQETAMLANLQHEQRRAGALTPPSLGCVPWAGRL